MGNQERISWGIVGNNYLRFVTPGSTRPGIRRYLEAGVQFEAPPLFPEFCDWQSSEKNCYETESESDPREAVSFWDLSMGLRKRRQLGSPLDEQDPEVHQLDFAVNQLLDLTTRMHERSLGLGLLAPTNILLLREQPDSRKSGLKLLLPDVGFYYAGAIEKPAWYLDKYEFAGLWADDRKLLEQQSRTTSTQLTTNGGDLDPCLDVRLLAKLFMSSLLGESMPSIPDPDVWEETSNHGPAPELWELLAQAIKGEIETPAEFRSRLANSPLSQHFTKRPEPLANPNTQRNWLAIGGLIAVVLGTVAFLFTILRDPEVDPRPPTPPVETVTAQPKPDSHPTPEPKPLPLISLEGENTSAKFQDPPPLESDSASPEQLQQLLASLETEDFAKQTRLLQELYCLPRSQDSTKRAVEEARIASCQSRIINKIRDKIINIQLEGHLSKKSRISEIQALLMNLNKLPSCPFLQTEQSKCLNLCKTLEQQL